MELNFYKCVHCANILVPAVASGVTPSCCGETMELLKAGAVDAAVEKHVPEIVKDEDGHHVVINVGSVAHPMADDHYIEVVVLCYESRTYIFRLKPGEEPSVKCSIRDNSVPLTAYAYCNLHGLWKVDV